MAFAAEVLPDHDPHPGGVVKHPGRVRIPTEVRVLAARQQQCSLSALPHMAPTAPSGMVLAGWDIATPCFIASPQSPDREGGHGRLGVRFDELA
jgi:hypothetical protein